MKIKTSVRIKASAAKIWKVISNIESVSTVIPAISKIEVLDKGENGLEGFRWKETRQLFGKEAQETMTITEVSEEKEFICEAESNGVHYLTDFSIEEKEGYSVLSVSMLGTPLTLPAKLMMRTLGLLFKLPTMKAFHDDLNSYKSYIESHAATL